MEISSSEDPYKGWKETYDGNALAAMGANKKAPSSQMFQKLFRYIVGVNSESKVRILTQSCFVMSNGGSCNVFS